MDQVEIYQKIKGKPAIDNSIQEGVVVGITSDLRPIIGIKRGLEGWHPANFIKNKDLYCEDLVSQYKSFRESNLENVLGVCLKN